MSKQLHILLLEDNIADAELVQRELRKAGMDIEFDWVNDKAPFLESLERQAPDLIIADYYLPGFDGLVALKMAREKFPHVPGIIVSGAMGEETAIEALRGGATDYVLKHHLSRLAPVVERALQEAEEIAERKQAEARLRESHAQLDTILRSAPDGIVFFGQDGEIREINQTGREIIGFTEDMLRLPMAELALRTQPMDEQGQPIAVEQGAPYRALQGETVRGQIINLRGTPRGSIWVSASAVPVRDEQGAITGAVAVFTDITAQRQTQEEAQVLAAELEMVLSAIADGVAVYDRDGLVIRQNDAALRLTGWTPEMMRLPPAERLQRAVVRDESGRMLTPEEAPLGRALAGQEVTGQVVSFERPTGEALWLRISAAPLRSDTGSLSGAVVIFSDITRMRQVEEELRAHRDHLEGLVQEHTAELLVNQQRLRALAAELSMAEQRERQRLASAIHDEVAQTLGVIKLHLNILQGDAAAEAVAPKVGEIGVMVDEAIRQSRTIMTELSPPILRQQGLLETLRWWAAQVQEKHGLEVAVKVTGTMPRLDPDIETTMFYAVKELLQNTIKHARATRATIEVDCAETRLDIEVADDGVGFDPAAVEMTEKGGFGLFSVRERMAYLGGELTVESEPRKGTRYALRLPLPCHVETPADEVAEAVS